MRTVLLGLILGYRRFLSPVVPPSCRFFPSCSAYAYEAVSKHGAINGVRLAVWRVIRCNPWNAGGLDPVP